MLGLWVWLVMAGCGHADRNRSAKTEAPNAPVVVTETEAIADLPDDACVDIDASDGPRLCVDRRDEGSARVFALGLPEDHGWKRGDQVWVARPEGEGTITDDVAFALVLGAKDEFAELHVVHQSASKLDGGRVRPLKDGERARLGKYIARIRELKGERVRLDVGQGDGVRQGDSYVVVSSAEGHAIGRVRVVSVEDAMHAWAEVEEKSEAFAVDQVLHFLGSSAKGPGEKRRPLRIIVTNFDPVDAGDPKEGKAARSFAKQFAVELADIAENHKGIEVHHVTERVSMSRGRGAGHEQARKLGDEHGADLVVWGSMRCSDRGCAIPQYTVVQPELWSHGSFQGAEMWLDDDGAGYEYDGDMPKDPVVLAQTMLGTMAFEAQRYGDAAYYLGRALEEKESSERGSKQGVGPEPIRGRDALNALHRLTYAQYVRGQTIAARQTALRLEVRARRVEDEHYEIRARGELARLDELEGDVEGARVRLQSMLTWSSEHEDRSAIHGFTLHQLARLEAQSGDVGKARELLLSTRPRHHTPYRGCEWPSVGLARTGETRHRRRQRKAGKEEGFHGPGAGP